MNMTDEQMRIAIAEACGWNSIREQDYDHGYSGNDVRQMWVGLSPDLNEFEQLPDYCNNLNAMHEAEKVLTEKGVNAWWAYVAHINRNNPTPFRAESAVHATARQRAEAFIKTLNLEPK
jgi:hypothetical protein